ncbi:MAG: hypothetical protein K8T20_04455 [Planctomycetes bacterium]|nr:hypothetical protein [Planctomycetota bacterium]
MYTQLASKLSVTTAGGAQVSPAVSMEGNNAFQAEFTVYALVSGATSIDVDTQGSNDLQNWTTFSSAYNLAVVGSSAPAARTAVAFQFVRFKYTSIGGGGTVVLACGLNTASL